MGKGTSKANANTAPAKDAWRSQDPKFQEKTEGGVYFYDSPNAIWGQAVDKKLYNSLPSYAKKSVISCDQTQTADGLHCQMYYIDKTGTVQWFDEYGKSDFLYLVKQIKDEAGLASDWQYEGVAWKVGMQLKRR